MKVRRKPRKTLLIILIVIMSLAMVCSAIYFLAFRTFTIVSDSAFSQVLPKATLRRLGISMATKGIRLKVENLGDDSFMNEDLFTSRIRKVRGDWVVLSPVSSAYAVSGGINVSELLERSVVIALHGNVHSGLFDCNLVSDEKTGWIQAAGQLADEFATTSRNVALIYEKESLSYLQDIVDCFGYGRLSLFEDQKGSGLFVNETKKELADLGIVVAMCPSDRRLGDFFKTADTLFWVVDYRFAPAVPSGQLYGMVAPDFESAFNQAMDVTKGSASVVTMEFLYEKL